MDLADKADILIAETLERALPRPLPIGLEECDLCGEPISPLRQNYGATLCMYHQEMKEREKGVPRK